MKIHLVTIGSPKLEYAQSGWNLYIERLKHYHSVRVTHISDKQNDATHITAAAGWLTAKYLRSRKKT